MDGIPHNFPDFIYWGFYSLLSAVLVIGVSSLKKLQQDVHKISIMLATFEERFRDTERRLASLEDSRKN